MPLSFIPYSYGPPLCLYGGGPPSVEARLGLFVELFERLATFSFPRGKSVCAPAVYDSRRRRWTGKLRILGEDQEVVLVDKRAIGNELFALGYGVGIDLGGWAFLQDGGGTLEYDEAIRRTLAPRLADVGARGVGKRVAANEDIDSGLVEFLASKKLVQFGAGRGDSLAGPVEISAVRRLFAFPRGRKSLIVADVIF